MSLTTHHSLPTRVRLMIVGTSAAALLMACVIFFGSASVWYQRKLEADLISLATLIGQTSRTALEVDDPGGSRDAIATLKGHPDVMAGFLYRPDSTVVGSYVRPGVSLTAPAKAPPEGLAPDHLGFATVVKNPQGQPVGTVFLQYDPALKRDFQNNCIRLALVALGFCVVSAFVLAACLQRGLTRPLHNLLATMKQVATQKNYGLRAERVNHDELGDLVTGFNDMLAQIQARDRRLQDSEAQLEKLVAQRTAERKLLGGEKSLGDGPPERRLRLQARGGFCFCRPPAQRALRVTTRERGRWPRIPLFKMFAFGSVSP